MADFVSNSPKGFQLQGRLRLCWILKSPVNWNRPGKYRTLLPSTITNGDHIVECLFQKLAEFLRRVSRNIDACFLHHLDRTRMQTLRSCSCAVDVILFASK